ncbi:hypothetical protein [Actinomadura sp. J1-007]|nr:hypothetical protein [Actinomadura sp. J1-007]
MAINHEKDVPAALGEDLPPPDAQVEDEPNVFVRFRETIRRNALLNTTWRIGVFTVG